MTLWGGLVARREVGVRFPGGDRGRWEEVADEALPGLLLSSIAPTGRIMTDFSSLEWILGWFLAAKMLGGRRRRRALRWALKRMIERTSSQQDRCTAPAAAAYHQGAHGVYMASLCAFEGTERPRDEPPADPSLRDAWQRGREEAARHSQEMFEQIIGQPLPS